MIKAVIVDDEPKAIQSLSWELTNFSDEIEILEKLHFYHLNIANVAQLNFIIFTIIMKCNVCIFP